MQVIECDGCGKRKESGESRGYVDDGWKREAIIDNSLVMDICKECKERLEQTLTDEFKAIQKEARSKRNR